MGCPEHCAASKDSSQLESPVSSLKSSLASHLPLDPEVTSCSVAGSSVSFSYRVCAGCATPFAPPASANTEATSGDARLVPPIGHQGITTWGSYSHSKPES